jgi:hypothetical protein
VRILVALILLGAVACETVPITGRSQLLLVAEGTEVQMGLKAGYHPSAARDLWVRMGEASKDRE